MTRYGVNAEIAELTVDLAIYLSRAGDVTRLLRLFADDRWLRRGWPESRRWEAYGRDLALAWDALEENLHDRPGAVVDCVRLAVIRGTLTTVEDFPASVMTAAVRTGYWTPERTLSTIDRLSRPAERAVCCHYLLASADLDVHGRRPVESRLIRLAGLPTDELPARTLLSGLHLMSSAGREAVAIAIQETARVVEWQMPDKVAPPELPHEDVVAADAVEILFAGLFRGDGGLPRLPRRNALVVLFAAFGRLHRFVDVQARSGDMAPCRGKHAAKLVLASALDLQIDQAIVHPCHCRAPCESFRVGT